MKNKPIDNAKVGSFVLAGLLFLILMLYMIGKNRNLFGSTFMIKAVVSNVNGLVPGNNVRFKGIDVGTVKSISLGNDTAIYITLMIDNKMKPYIRKNAIASVSTDGLMGNKLININSQTGESPLVEDGDFIYSQKPVETDEMLRTLNTTNKNMEKITHNLFEISAKLNNSKSLWTLLADTVITRDLKLAVVDLRRAGNNTARMTSTVNDLAKQLQAGDGLVQKLFTDTTFVRQWSTALQQVQLASTQTATMMNDLGKVVQGMRNGDGAAGLVLSDTLLRNKLLKSAGSIEQGTSRFNENMEALKSNFLFKKYFKKLEKDQELSKKK